MAIDHGRATVSTTASIIVQADADGTSGIIRIPPGGAIVYVGKSNVTTATGFPLYAGDVHGVDLASSEAIYGIVASGTQAVPYFLNRA